MASELVGETGKVFAFEPLPSNIVYLKKHIKINKLANVSVVKAAVSDKNGSAFMEINKGYSIGRICDNGDLKIRTVALDDCVRKGKLPAPNVLKIDAEGAELSVLKGADSILKKNKPIIFCQLIIKIFMISASIIFYRLDTN